VHEHRHETEIKLAVRNPGQLKRRLRELGFHVVTSRHFESNYLYDFPDQRLRKMRCILRLRFAGRRSLLTFKGAPLHSRNYKIRREIETIVENGGQLRELLENLGLREVFSYEKYRTAYAPRGKRPVCDAPYLLYDETPIGNYIELEGPKRWIDEISRQIGYSRKQYITSSYAVLYRQKSLARGIKPGNMVFPPRKS
jgi:adenylate cyclase, class 2